MNPTDVQTAFAAVETCPDLIRDGILHRGCRRHGRFVLLRECVACRLEAAGVPRPFVRPGPYAGLLPDCLHAAPGMAGSCAPIRCRAHKGSTCGGSHADLDHCSRCAAREP